MATLTKTDDLGVDVAKDWLDLYDGQCLVRIDNSDQSINDYVKSLNRPHSIAIEAQQDTLSTFWTLIVCLVTAMP